MPLTRPVLPPKRCIIGGYAHLCIPSVVKFGKSHRGNPFCAIFSSDRALSSFENSIRATFVNVEPTKKKHYNITPFVQKTSISEHLHFFETTVQVLRGLFNLSLHLVRFRPSLCLSSNFPPPPPSKLEHSNFPCQFR